MRRLLTVLAFTIAGICLPTTVQANQSQQTAYCTAPVALSQGQIINAPPLLQDLNHAEQCGGQYGDLWSDGPFYNPALTGISPSSLQFTIPAQVWVAQGQRIAVPAILETAPPSVVSYWWLSTATDQYSYTTVNVAPDSSSVLEYTVTANGTGVVSTTAPTMAGLLINGALTLGALPANSCLQTGVGGIVTATGSTCGAGSAGVASVVAGANISVATVSGTATVSGSMSPLWTGVPSVASASQAGTLGFGSDGLATLARTAASTFTFTAPSGALVTSANGFAAGSSTYGPTSSFVAGQLTATALAGSTLTPGNCVQATTGGVLTTSAAPCAPGVTTVQPGLNVVVSTIGSTATVSTTSNPAFTGSATAGSGTAYIPFVSDLSASDSTSSGGLDLGGSSSHCRIDYGDTTTGTLTFGCPMAGTTEALSGALTGTSGGFSGILTAPEFNITGTNLTGCNICIGTSGTTTSAFLSYGAGSGLGFNTLSATNSTLTFGSQNIPGNGLAITNSVAGLIDVFDGAGSLGIAGDLSAGHSVRSLRSVIGGYATAVAPITANWGDVEGSRSVSTGNLNLGGTTSSCNLDYGITSASGETFGCPVAMPQVRQAATNDFAGTCTNSSGATCTATLAAAFTTPLCWAQDQSSTNKVDVTCAVSSTTVTVTNAPSGFVGTCAMSASSTCTIAAPYAYSGAVCLAEMQTATAGIGVTCSISGTTITVTATSNNSLTWNVMLRGTPSASGHTFNYHIIGNPN